MTNMKNPEDMNEDEVNEISNLLRNQMSGLRFAKDAKFVKSKSPWAIGIAAAAVSAIAISFSLGSGAVTPTWAAEPNANAETQSASEASCAGANAAGDSIVLTSTAPTLSTPSIPNDSATVEAHASAVVAQGSGNAALATPKDGAITAQGSGTITLSSAPVVQAFDSRGTYAVTVMGGSTTDQGSATIICVTSTSKSGSPVSGISVLSSQSAGSPATDNFNATTNQDGTKTTVGYGLLVPGATQVILSVKGLPDAQATIYGDSYAIWWPYDGTSSAVIKQLDASGKILKTIDVPVGDISVGGIMSMSATASLTPGTLASDGSVTSYGSIIVETPGTTTNTK